MEKAERAKLRGELGYFENYIEPVTQAPDGSTVKIILSIAGLAVLVSAGASLYGWLF